MNNVFLIDENTGSRDENHINENDIIYRQNNLSEGNNNRVGIYDIHKLIHKQITKENIIFSTEDTEKIYNSNKLHYSLSLNELGGLNYKKNVIGFRLIECIFTSPVFNITDNNNSIITTESSNDITIPNGYYTIDSLITKINALASTYSASYSFSTCKVTLNGSGTVTTFKSLDNNPLLNDLGFRYNGEKILTSSSPYEAETHPSLNTGTYMDIVIDEIPYGACKRNPNGLNIIHRIPITNSTTEQILGPVIHYKVDKFIDDNLYLFPPMNLSHLTIHLYLDNKKYMLENTTMSFEFELTIINK